MPWIGSACYGRSSAARGLLPLAPVTNGGDEPAWDGAALTRVLRGITGGLAAGFDLPRVLGMFLDAIAELVHPTRLAVLLPDPTGNEFRIAANRGLAPQLVQSIRLSAHDGLVGWLTEQGRPAANGDLGDPEILRELKLLQAVVAVPLLAHGELVAVLTLGQPVFGAAYGRRQMETLFDLAAHLATALRDITLHHQLGREKEFSERILSHMSSGVVTIGRDQRVGTFNRRAEEILQLPATGVVGQDLRILPSPARGHALRHAGLGPAGGPHRNPAGAAPAGAGNLDLPRARRGRPTARGGTRLRGPHRPEGVGHPAARGRAVPAPDPSGGPDRRRDQEPAGVDQHLHRADRRALRRPRLPQALLGRGAPGRASSRRGFRKTCRVGDGG